MSPIKEPKFLTSLFLKFPHKGIGDDKVDKYIIINFNDYKKLFFNVIDEKSIGEASADYLYYYKNTIPYIKKILGETKIIIILRNPINRTHSAYTMLIRDNREYLSFEDALKEERKRMRNNWEFIWFYKDVGFYYNQVKAYLDNFQKIKIYLFDDLKQNPFGLMENLYEFLGVNSSFVPHLGIKYNVSGIPKNKFIHNFLTKPSLLKSSIKPLVKALIPREKIIAMQENTHRTNLGKQKMKEETRRYLIQIFKEDISKLQDLIKKDLTHWLK